MGIKKLNFTGFKSFADKISINFPSNLTAVVGPNGCGKSNIVDGIRWVIGEASSKQLRGQHMSDVIFNGTANRNPMGQAIAEIVFDNSDGMLGGEYAKYSDILIRREVSSDGGSDYFINNTRCRRKDIIDMFLGTGLGSQNYAIVEQGMITEITDAKPDDLRLLIEEAAGISKYKERRRATERRMGQTKENLARLNDIRTEIESQLKVLKKQSRAAEYYQKLRKDERTFEAKINAWQWQTLNTGINEYQCKISNEETILNAKIADQRHTESSLETLRQQSVDAEDGFNTIQNNFYKLNSEIAQLEQRIHYNRSRISELKQEQTKIEQERQETIEQKKNDQGQNELLSSEIEKLESQKKTASEELAKAQQELKQNELSYEKFQENWEQFNQKYADLITQVEVNETKLHYLKQNQDKVTNNLNNLLKEKDNTDLSLLNNEINALNTQHQKLIEELNSKQSTFVNNQQEIISLRSNNSNILNKLDQLKQQLQKLTHKETSLSTLQKAAFGANDTHIENWLKDKDLHNNQRLLKELQVDPHWETALETVLNNYFDAVCVDHLDSIIPHITTDDVPHNLSFLAETHQAAHISNNKISLQPLSDKLTNSQKISPLLSGIYIANNLHQAIEYSPSLSAHESIVTQDGVWVGPNWLRMKNVKNELGGVLQREKELAVLTNQINALKPNIANLEVIVNNNRDRIKTLDNEQVELQRTLDKIRQQKNAIHNNLASKTTQLQSLQQRQTVLLNEIAGYEKNLTGTNQELESISSLLDQNKSLIAQNDTEQKELQEQRSKLKAALEISVSNEAEHRKTSIDAERRLELIQKEIGYLQQNLTRSEKRLSTLNERNSSASETLQELLTPEDDLNKQLEQNLEQRLVIEEDLNTSKQQLDDLNNQVRSLEQKRNIIQEEAQNIRISLEKLRITEEGTKVKSDNFSAQVQQAGFNLQELVQELFPKDNTEDDANEDNKEPVNLELLENKLGRVIKRIDNLGPINLTAIDEYTKQQERKTYLDAQNDDLIAALNTLQNAIYKIDHETKHKFKDTFESVNETFTALFPKIFNGGKASLRLSNDDLLNTGIEIFAQPPGKRNTSIHLLSGGEKTLTAIALIFSMFQLNPAPFCLLDEVDAPLDDENVNRFCNLVKEMSSEVQFIYITHNKIAMEMSDQLLGVTMKEPGVSRVVAVDIKQALDMAEEEK